MYILSFLVSFILALLFFFSLVLPIDEKRKPTKTYGFLFSVLSIVTVYLMPTDFSEDKELFKKHEWQN